MNWTYYVFWIYDLGIEATGTVSWCILWHKFWPDLPLLSPLRCIINVKSNSICDPELLGSLTRFPRDISIMKHLTHAFYRFFQKPWEIDRPDISHIILLNDFILKAPPLSLCIFNIPQGLMMVPYPYQAYNLRGNSLSWDQIFDPCCDSGADRRDVEETLSPCLCDYWGG